MATEYFGTAGGGYYNFRGVNTAPYNVGRKVFFNTNRVIQAVGVRMAGYSTTASTRDKHRGVLWDGGNNPGTTDDAYVLSYSGLTTITYDAQGSTSTSSPFAWQEFNVTNYYCPAGNYHIGFWRDSDQRTQWDVENASSNTSKTSGATAAGSVPTTLDDSGSGTVFRGLVCYVTYTDVTVTDAPTFTVSQGYGSATITDLAIADDGTNSVSISPWGISYQRSLNGGAWTAISEGGVITGLTVGQEYNIRVRAINPVGASAASDYDYVTPYGLPIMNSAEFEFVAGEGNVILWDADANYDDDGIDYYHIYRSVNGGTFAYYHQTDATETADSTYTDTSVSVGNTYNYRVYAHNRAGWSSYAETGAGLVAIEPGQPLNLLASDIGPDYVELTWNPPASNGGESVDFYNLYLRVGENDFWIDTIDLLDLENPSIITYIVDYVYDDVNDQDIFISPNQTYTFLVDAENLIGPGSPSIITVTTIGGVVKYFDPDLEQWVYKPVKVYNVGTGTWENASVRKYNGTSWEYI